MPRALKLSFFDHQFKDINESQLASMIGCHRLNIADIVLEVFATCNSSCITTYPNPLGYRQ
jgi:hypothetical protein